MPEHFKDTLVRPAAAEEVRKALFSIKADKAPGLDGFNDYLYKKNWELVWPDMVEGLEAVSSFFASGYLLKVSNLQVSP